MARVTDLPDHLAVDSLRASASLSDWATVKSVLHTAAPTQLRSLVVELLRTERQSFSWEAAERRTRPATR